MKSHSSAPPHIPAVNLDPEYVSIREEIEEAIRRVLDRKDFILGVEVEQLEQEMARLHGCADAVACASGSDALLLSLMACGVGPVDSVIVPAFTFFATAGAVARLGARPIFVDITPRTFNISPEAAEQAVRNSGISGQIKAMIPVHLYGQCADMDPLLELGKRHGVAIVEDVAQAVLARYRGRAAGSMGAVGCFSFYPTKNLGAAGDAGMITASDAEMATQLRLLRNHGSANKREFALLGINSRLDTLQAAILLVKLTHLHDWTQRRQQRAAVYHEALSASGLVAPRATYPSADAPLVLPHIAPDCEHVYHQFTIRAYRRDELMQHLAAQGIGVAIHYSAPLHRQPVFAHLPEPHCPEAERAAREVLCLPISPWVTDEQILSIAGTIASFYRQ